LIGAWIDRGLCTADLAEDLCAAIVDVPPAAGLAHTVEHVRNVSAALLHTCTNTRKER